MATSDENIRVTLSILTNDSNFAIGTPIVKVGYNETRYVERKFCAIWMIPKVDLYDVEKRNPMLPKSQFPARIWYYICGFVIFLLTLLKKGMI
jgi:hypothetical protein